MDPRAVHEDIVNRKIICLIRTNKMNSSLLIYFINPHLHVTNRLTIRHQKVVYCICSVWYLSRIYAY
jgi:hypothetical protein